MVSLGFFAAKDEVPNASRKIKKRNHAPFFSSLHLEFFPLDAPIFDSLYILLHYFYTSHFMGGSSFYSPLCLFFIIIYCYLAAFCCLFLSCLWLALPVCISLSDDDSSIYIERDHGHRVIFLKDSISCVDGVNAFYTFS